MLESKIENLDESDSWSTLLCLFLLEISSFNYLLLSDFADWGCFWVQLSWQLGHTFGLPLCKRPWLFFVVVVFFLYPWLNTSQLMWCMDIQRWLEMAPTGTRLLKVSSQTGHNCHPCTEILKAMANIGATAGNCSFFLNQFSTLSQVPQGCGYSRSSGRPKVTYAWNDWILEKIFPNVSREESGMTVPWVGKKWTPLQSDLWINTMPPQDLNLLQNF